MTARPTPRSTPQSPTSAAAASIRGCANRFAAPLGSRPGGSRWPRPRPRGSIPRMPPAPSRRCARPRRGPDQDVDICRDPYRPVQQPLILDSAQVVHCVAGCAADNKRSSSMRKALMGLILAATAMSPVAASSQDWHNRGDRGGRGARSQNESGDSGETRSERHQRQEVRQAPQPAVQPAPQPQVVERQRGGDGNRGSWRGGDNNNRGDWNRGDDGNRRTRTNQGSIYPQAWQGDPNSPMLRHYQQVERQNQQRYDGRRDDGRNWRDRNDRRDWRDGDHRDRRTS